MLGIEPGLSSGATSALGHGASLQLQSVIFRGALIFNHKVYLIHLIDSVVICERDWSIVSGLLSMI